MNILHIVSGELFGGAARGAYWLHQGLLQLGADSKVLINSVNNSNDPSVETTITNNLNKINGFLHFQIDQFPLKLYTKRENHFFSTAIYGYNLTGHPLYKWADIIHLHWINRGFISIKQLSKIQKPIVWTLRDMWPLTGGCHYSLECENYKYGCGNCIQLGSNKNHDLSKFIINRKIKFFPKNMTIVGISNWISNTARESKVFKDYNIQTIFNNVNCNDFFPIEKETAKRVLGLNTTKKIILTGAHDISAHYKGFSKYLEALKYIDSENNFLLFFGNIDKTVKEIHRFKYKSFGFLNDIISLRLVYSAADVFVAPSLFDAFGKTITESMACGTPVVSFNSTGPKDIIDHKVNGYKATPFDPEDIYNGINWILQNPDYNSLAENARIKVTQSFDSVVIAEQYLKLYESLK